MSNTSDEISVAKLCEYNVCRYDKKKKEEIITKRILLKENGQQNKKRG